MSRGEFSLNSLLGIKKRKKSSLIGSILELSLSFKQFSDEYAPIKGGCASLELFINRLHSAKREVPDVGDAYRSLIGGSGLHPHHCDWLCRNVLFEFKFNNNISGPSGKKAVAQAIYYFRKIKQDHRFANPSVIAVCNEKQAFCIDTQRIEPLINGPFDWSMNASKPDGNLVNEVGRLIGTPHIHNMRSQRGVEGFLLGLDEIGERAVARVVEEKRLIAEEKRIAEEIKMREREEKREAKRAYREMRWKSVTRWFYTPLARKLAIEENKRRNFESRMVENARRRDEKESEILIEMKEDDLDIELID